MRKVFTLALLMLALPAFASTNLTVGMPGGGNAPSGAYVRADLVNCQNPTIVNSSTPVNPSQRFYFNLANSVTFTVPDNVTQIACSGNMLSFYTFTYVANGVQTIVNNGIGVELNSGTFNLANLNGLTSVPFNPGVIQGPAGQAGINGPPLNVRGAWAIGTTYAAGDVVSYNGGLYVSLLAANIGNIPSSTPSYWQSFGFPATGTGGTGTVQIVLSNGTLAASDGTTILNNLPIQTYRTVANPAIAAFQNALDNCQNQVVNIIYEGDSRFSQADDDFARIGGTPTVIDVPRVKRHANLMMQELQRRCPSHGTGLVPFVPAIPFAYSYVPIWGNTGSLGTTTELGPFFGSQGSLVIATTANALTFNDLDAAWDTLKVYCAEDSTSTGFSVSIDGGTPVNICNATNSTPLAITTSVPALSLGYHSAVLTPLGAHSLLYGAEGTAGAVGVSVHNLGVGSAPAGWAFGNPSTAFAFSDLIGPQALVMTNHLTNEPGTGESVAAYTAALQAFIAHEQALSPAPSMLFFAPMQDAVTGLAPYYAAMQTIAQTAGIGYLDMRTRVGTSFISGYFGPDGIHENTLGNAMNYEAILAATVTGKSSPSYVAPAPSGQVQVGYGPHGAPLYAVPETLATSCGAGYSYYVPLSIPASVVKESAANFPVALLFNGAATNSITLTDLKTVANSGHVQSSTGLDIIVCSALTGGIQYPHELVNYVATSGLTEMYVRFPQLSTTAATTAYLFIGNSLAGDTSRAKQVWSNGYVGVYHFGSAGATNYFTDSTGNNTLAGAGSYAQSAGQYGYYAVLPSGTSLGNGTPINLPQNNDARTIEFAFNAPTFPGSPDGFMAEWGNYGAEGNWGIQAAGAMLRTETANNRVTIPFTPDGNWHFVASILPQGGAMANTRFFLDGATVTPTCAACSITVKTQAGPIVFNGDNSLGGGYLNENLDEVRFSSVARSSGWLSTQYNNFTNPATFVTLGTETATPNAPYTGTCTSPTSVVIKAGIITGCS